MHCSGTEQLDTSKAGVEGPRGCDKGTLTSISLLRHLAGDPLNVRRFQVWHTHKACSWQAP